MNQITNNQRFAFTFYFEEVFDNYEDFKTFTDSLNLYESTDAISEEFNQYLYSILSRHYAHNDIRYSDIDSFKLEFANVYTNNFKLLQRRNYLIQKQYEINEQDLEIIGLNLTNSAFNPNNAVTEPLKPLNYISTQNYTVTQLNKLNAYINAINQMKDLDIGVIIDKFDFLFIQFYQDNYNINFYQQN